MKRAKTVSMSSPRLSRALVAVVLLTTACGDDPIETPAPSGPTGPTSPTGATGPTYLGVASTTPSDDAVDVARLASVVVTFDAEVEPTTVTETSAVLSAGGSAVAVSRTIQGSTVTLTPLAALAPETSHTLTLTTAITSTAGDALENDVVVSFTTEPLPVVPVLNVLLTDPSADSVDVEQQPTIVITFDADLGPSSIDDTSVVLSQNGTPLGMSRTVDGATLTLVPDAPLATLALHTVSLSTAVASLGGAFLASPFSFSFTTTTFLNVSATTPVADALDVSRQAPLVVTFDADLDSLTVDETSVILSDGAGPVAVTRTVDAQTLTITPDDTLAPSTLYTLSLGVGLTSSAGYPLVAPHSVSFTTAGVLTVVDTYPAAAAANVPTNSTLTITFGAPLDPGSIDTDAVVLRQGSTIVATTATAFDNLLSVDPTVNLTGSTAYTLTLSSAILSAAGYPLDAEVVLSFSTDAGASFAVVSTSPEVDAMGVSPSSIVVNFNASVAAGTVTSTTFRVRSGGADVPGNSVVQGSQVTFTPAEPFAAARVYSLAINGVYDATNTLYLYSYRLGFVTGCGADCRPPQSTVDAPGGGYNAPVDVTLSCTDAISGCKRLVYTTDGSLPTFSPAQGTVVEGSSAGPITIGSGQTTLRYRAEDNAGNVEVPKEQSYVVTTDGLIVAGTRFGLAMAAGVTPTGFVYAPTAPIHLQRVVVEPLSGTLYGFVDDGLNIGGALLTSTDDGATWSTILRTKAQLTDIAAVGNEVTATALFASASSGGLFVSSNWGATFAHQDAYFGNAYALTATPRELLVGTPNGLSRLHDGMPVSTAGSGNGLPSNDFRAVFRQGARVYAGTTAGLAVSENGGADFVNRTTADGLGSNEVRGIYAEGDAVWAATGAGLSVSDDGGVSFTNRTTADGLASNDVLRVTEVGGLLYVSTAAGLSISENDGDTFVNRTMADGLGSDRVYDVVPVGGGLFVASGAKPAFSSDGGETFDVAPTGSGVAGVQVFEVEVYGTSIYVGTSMGLSISADRGRTWRHAGMREGLGSEQVNTVYISGETLYVGTTGGLSISTDDGVSFVNRTTADGLIANNVRAVLDRASDLLVGIWEFTGGIASSEDGGESFDMLAWSGNYIKYLATNGTRLFSVSENQAYRYTDNNGTNITSISNFGGCTGTPSEIYVSGQTVYMAHTYCGFLLSDNGGTSFTRKTYLDGLGQDTTLGVAVTGSAIYVGTSWGVSVSTNAGVGFTNVSAGLTDGFVWELAVLP